MGALVAASCTKPEKVTVAAALARWAAATRYVMACASAGHDASAAAGSRARPANAANRPAPRQPLLPPARRLGAGCHRLPFIETTTAPLVNSPADLPVAL